MNEGMRETCLLGLAVAPGKLWMVTASTATIRSLSVLWWPQDPSPGWNQVPVLTRALASEGKGKIMRDSPSPPFLDRAKLEVTAARATKITAVKRMLVKLKRIKLGRI